MSINAHILTASSDIKPYFEVLKSISDTTVASVEKLLSIKDIDIVFYDNPIATIDEMGGIGGYSPNKNLIFISLNPRHLNFKNAIINDLSFILAHELHHTIRWQKQVDGDTLLEALIFEGLAEHFAHEATGKNDLTPYSNALTTEQKEIYFKMAKEEWSQLSYDNNLWFFGSRPDVVPRWTGYTLGYDLVAKYLRDHPETSASKLAFADASIFVPTK